MAKSKLKPGFNIHSLYIGGCIEQIQDAFSAVESRIWEGLKGECKAPMVLYLNTSGGCVDTADSFCKLLKELKKERELWTVIHGSCSSAGIDLYLEGQKRFKHGSCSMLFHRAYTNMETGDKWQTQDHETAIAGLGFQDKILERQFKMLKLPLKTQRDIRAGQDVTIEGDDLHKYGITTHKGTVWDYIRRNYGQGTRKKTVNRTVGK